MKNLLKKYSEVINHFAECPIAKDSKNAFQNYTYASTEIVLRTVNQELHKRGLVMRLWDFTILPDKTQSVPNYSKENKTNGKTGAIIEQLNGFVVYRMRYILHDLESEANITFEIDVPFDNTQDNFTKGFGSTSTYAQRYVYGEIFHLGFNEDSPDASHANKPKNDNQYPKAQAMPVQAAPNANKGISEAQSKRLFAIFAKAGISKEDVKKFMLAKYKCNKSDELNKTQYDELCNIIESGNFQEAFMNLVDVKPLFGEAK